LTFQLLHLLLFFDLAIRFALGKRKKNSPRDQVNSDKGEVCVYGWVGVSESRGIGRLFIFYFFLDFLVMPKNKERRERENHSLCAVVSVCSRRYLYIAVAVLLAVTRSLGLQSAIINRLIASKQPIVCK
jgi:hypothetical protein